MKEHAFERLFALFLEHLQQRHGLGLAREGVMIDATFVEVPRQRNSREQNARIKAGEVPREFAGNPKLAAHKDCDARWTKKNHETFHGYKDHVKVDVADQLILAGVATAAHVHDSQPIAGLVREGDRVAYADSAYRSAAIDADLAGKNVEGQICEEATRAAALTEEQKSANRGKSRVRSLCRARLRADDREHAGAAAALHRPGPQRRLHPAHQPCL